MHRKILFTILIALPLCGLCESKTVAQGGWRQWDIHLRDGSKVEANPLSATDDGHISVSLESDGSPGKGIELSKIDYIAARRSNLPDAPTGDFEQDLVVLMDGRRLFGPITSIKAEWSEGGIVQNEKRISLEGVAYIKFAKPRSDSKNKARNSPGQSGQ